MIRRTAWVSVLAGLAVIVVGAVAWWRPFVTDPRPYPASIPQPSPLYSLPFVNLKAGQQVCFEPAVMDTHSQRAEFRVTTYKRAGAPIALTISGPGYRFAGRTSRGYPDGELLQVPVHAPPHDLAVRICLRNEGAHTIGLFGDEDQTRAPFKVTVDGKDSGAAVQFAFYERKPVSILHRLPASFDRMQVFRPGFLGPWLFWPLAIFCVVGVPLGALWALWRAVADEEDVAPPGLGLRGDAGGDELSAHETGLRRAVDVLRGMRPRARRRSAP